MHWQSYVKGYTQNLSALRSVPDRAIISSSLMSTKIQSHILKKRAFKKESVLKTSLFHVIKVKQKFFENVWKKLQLEHHCKWCPSMFFNYTVLTLFFQKCDTLYS